SDPAGPFVITPTFKRVRVEEAGPGFFDQDYQINLFKESIDDPIEWTIDWGDGSALETIAENVQPDGSTPAIHRYDPEDPNAEFPGEYAIRARATIASGDAAWQADYLDVTIGAAASGQQLSQSDYAGRRKAILMAFQEVYNTYKYQPYDGLMKGVEGTMATKSGNDWDQAAVLKKMIEDADPNADVKYVLAYVWAPDDNL